MSKHTEGPWINQSGAIMAHSDKQVIKREDAFDWVASIQISNNPKWEADARLIAAAPEMLAMLERLEWSYGGFCPICDEDFSEDGHRQHSADCELDALIKRAKGEG